jgi:hypothetical protein
MDETPIPMPLELADLLEATAALNEISTEELIMAAIKSFLANQSEEF